MFSIEKKVDIELPLWLLNYIIKIKFEQLYFIENKKRDKIKLFEKPPKSFDYLTSEFRGNFIFSVKLYGIIQMDLPSTQL